MEIINLIILFFAYIIPMYLANATPIVIHGKKPLDFGLKLKGKRILGDGKTIVGTIAGIVCGTIAGILLGLAFPSVLILIPNYFLLTFLLAVGAILGDAIESFIKRRLGFSQGDAWFIFDQLDFILGGLILACLIRIPEIELVVIILFITIIMHVISNVCAHKVGLKKVPW